MPATLVLANDRGAKIFFIDRDAEALTQRQRTRAGIGVSATSVL
jgi:hypothetical protein